MKPIIPKFKTGSPVPITFAGIDWGVGESKSKVDKFLDSMVDSMIIKIKNEDFELGYANPLDQVPHGAFADREEIEEFIKWLSNKHLAVEDYTLEEYSIAYHKLYAQSSFPRDNIFTFDFFDLLDAYGYDPKTKDYMMMDPTVWNSKNGPIKFSLMETRHIFFAIRHVYNCLCSPGEEKLQEGTKAPMKYAGVRKRKEYGEEQIKNLVDEFQKRDNITEVQVDEIADMLSKLGLLDETNPI